MIDSGPSTDVAPDANEVGADDAVSEQLLAKPEKKSKKKEQQAAGKSAEREQKLRWDADKIQLKWIRLTIVMAGIGFGADRVLHELSQRGVPPDEVLVLRLSAQTLAVLGLVALAIATFQHGRFLSALVRDEPMPVARFPLSLVVAAVIVTLGIVILWVTLTSLIAINRTGLQVPSDLTLAGTSVIVAATATAVPTTPEAAVRTQALATSPPATPAVVLTPVSATLQLTNIPSPAPTPTPGDVAATTPPVMFVVRGTGPTGARLRQAPVDGDTLTVLADGTRLTALDDTTSAGGQRWQRVRTEDDREGWIASELIASVNP